MQLANTRVLFFMAFLLCAAMLAGALYVEHVNGVEPCPLCIVQRLWVIWIGILSLLGCTLNPQRLGRNVYGVLSLLGSFGGIGATGYQLYLQNLPIGQVVECFPDLAKITGALPFQAFFGWFLQGSADCGEVSWSLFGMSLPEWSLLGFVALGALSISLFLGRSRRRERV